MVLLIGVPGCGKSTVSATFVQRGYHVHATDAIRKELYGSEDVRGKAPEVFQILIKRARHDLENGISCVIDATNVNRKHRMSILAQLKNAQCLRRCLLILTPVEECLRRNEARQRSVPYEVIDKMLRWFESPYYYEGWDSIESIRSEDPYVFPFDAAMTFEQDNPHHTATLGRHMELVEEYCITHGYSREVCEAARYHDVGKMYTKAFKNYSGQPTDIAHFYGHEGYSAYLYLLEMTGREPIDDAAWRRVLYIASLISWHMMPYQHGLSENQIEQIRSMIGEQMFNEIMQLHEGDISGH